MLKLEANIFPQFDLGPDDFSHLETILRNLSFVEETLTQSPLGQSPAITLARTEFDNGTEHSVGVLDRYEFIITRRYQLHGEWHVGGANGEILNVHTFLSGFKAALKDAMARRDSQA